MSIPLATTTIAIYLPNAGDPYEVLTETPSEFGVRAHFSSPSGSDLIVGGDQEQIDMRLVCDRANIPHYATIVDEKTNERWRVVWSRLREALGLDHVECGVRKVTGAVS